MPHRTRNTGHAEPTSCHSHGRKHARDYLDLFRRRSSSSSSRSDDFVRPAATDVVPRSPTSSDGLLLPLLPQSLNSDSDTVVGTRCLRITFPRSIPEYEDSDLYDFIAYHAISRVLYGQEDLDAYDEVTVHEM